MGKNSDIEWLKAWPGGGHSKSAWWGCTPAGPECKHCYAAAIALRFRGIEYRKGGLRARIGGFERSVRQMDDRAERTGERPLVFWSVSDPFDTEVPQGWFDAAWDVIARAKNLRWILLTKRPQHIRNRIRESVYSKLYVNPLAMVAHVSFGISAGTNDGFWERWPYLRDLPLPKTSWRILSLEPLLEPLELPHCWDQAKPDWVLIGGESGRQARYCNPDWIHYLIAQCQMAGIPVFVKQLGSHCGQVLSEGNGRGVPLPIKHSKGGDPSEWPAHLRVREMPKS